MSSYRLELTLVYIYTQVYRSFAVCAIIFELLCKFITTTLFIQGGCIVCLYYTAF